MSRDLLPLEPKPNFAEAVRRMEAFWAGEVIDRPAINLTAPLPDREWLPGGRYMEGARDEFGPIIERVVHNVGNTYFAGEAMPMYVPSFGPDQWAAWMGADLEWSDTDQSTNWVVPFVEDWEAVFPLRFETEGRWWTRMVDFMTELGQAAEGRFLVSHLDLHSNADALSAIRTPARLCMDFYDHPRAVDRAMRQVRGLFPLAYETFFAAAGMNRSGSIGWVPVYHPGRTNTIQCDFLALIGAEISRQYVMPALEEEASYLDAWTYHLDGPECLVHLDDLLALPDPGVIQWTTGARNAPMIEWMDLLKRIQQSTKGLWIPCSAEELKVYMRELRPERVIYEVGVGSVAEADALLAWMVEQT
jgi:hypothetical protein